MRVLVALLVMLPVGGCHPAVQPGAETLDNVSDPGELTLGPGDKFDIRVFGEPDFTGSYRVDPDGTISYPYIGLIKVEGLKPNELARLLTDRLGKDYLRHPQVNILVQEQVSKKITIIGQVAHPGTFSCTANMNIVEAITVAGGFTPMAWRNRTTITRTENGKKYSIQVPVAEIGEGKARNVAVRPGDIISVPEGLF